MVRSQYIPQRSSSEESLYFFAYFIRIANEGDQPATLMNRHWQITDATGKVEEVRGPGVVGVQPRLEPGQAFDYSSFCPLRTEFGKMEGKYEMVLDTGESFQARIAPFDLVAPHAVN